MNHTFLVTLLVLFAAQCSADFASDCVNAHNAHRTPLNIAPLTWSADIAKSAQAWAENLAAKRKLMHSPASGYGENLASRTGKYVAESVTTPATTTNNGQTSSSNTNTNTSQSQTGSQGSSQNTGSSTVMTNSTSAQTGNNNNGQNGNTSPNKNPPSAPTTNPNPTAANPGPGSNAGPQKGNAANNNQNKPNNKRQSFRYNDGGSTDSFDRPRRHLEEVEQYDEEDDRYLASYNNTALINSLVGQWGSEKKYFIYGTFPNVAVPNKTVGHYTQMIWGETKQMGCGIANNDGGWVYFVCEYYPYGNIRGKFVY